MRADTQRQARFLDIVAPHQGAIRKVAALYALDRADRDDLFQEITLALWRSFESYRGDAAFSTFLYRVALNTALLRVRSARRRPLLAGGAELEAVEARAEARDDEDVERLYAAIRELRPVDRAIVLLALEERSHDEIAAVTGLSTGNVSVRLSRARERLRQLLGVRGPTQGGTPCSTKR